VSFAVITLYVAPQRVIPKVRVYFVFDSVRKRLGSVYDISVLIQLTVGRINYNTFYYTLAI
jgi:hypothetical protein